MAITMMTSREHYEADPTDIKVVTDYHGANGPLYMHTTHRGLVLETGEVNGYDDSDFYAVVWNPTKGHPERVTYATTRGWTYPNGASVDATPEVIAAHAAWDAQRRENARIERDAREALVPRKGKVVKVVSGRKLPVGTEGTVVWYGVNKFATTRYLTGLYMLDERAMIEVGLRRVGINTGGQTVFVDAKNVEVLGVGATA